MFTGTRYCFDGRVGWGTKPPLRTRMRKRILSVNMHDPVNYIRYISYVEIIDVPSLRYNYQYFSEGSYGGVRIYGTRSPLWVFAIS